jgi:hypothetical protein
MDKHININAKKCEWEEYFKQMLMKMSCEIHFYLVF